MDWPQIGPKSAIKLGKNSQKDKWYPFRAPTGGGGGAGEKESIHRPAPVQNFSLPKKNGGHRGKISVVDMVFLVFIGFLYPPPAWKVFLWGQKSSPNDLLSVVVVYAFLFSGGGGGIPHEGERYEVCMRGGERDRTVTQVRLHPPSKFRKSKGKCPATSSLFGKV